MNRRWLCPVILAAAVGTGGLRGGLASAEDAPPALPTPWLTATDIAADERTGDVYVAVAFGMTFETARFSAEGQPKGRWQYTYWRVPDDVAVNARSGETFATTSERDKMILLRYAANGHRPAEIQTGYAGDFVDLAVEEDSGQITLARYYPDLEVMTLSVDCRLLRQWSAGVSERGATVARALDRSIYVGAPAAGGAGGRVLVFDEDGDKQYDWPVPEPPTALAQGLGDELLVLSATPATPWSGTAARWTVDGATRPQWALSGRPTDLDVTRAGIVYIALLRDGGRALAVARYDMEGHLLGEWMAFSRLFAPTVAKRG